MFWKLTGGRYWLWVSLSLTLSGGLPGSGGPAAAFAQQDRALAPVPKVETGADRFLEAHPDSDGRGTIVAIFDTGVDPAAAGLQTTSDGRPKIVDLVDATGSGDVALTKTAKLENHQVKGPTGRVLKLSPDWKIPSGEVRLGMKSAFELFPPEVIPRVKQHRQKLFDEQQRVLEHALREQIEHFDAEKAKAANPPFDKPELEKRLAALLAAGKNADDPGPVYDCLVFHDGTHWRAVVDTDEDGDLAEEKPLTNFRTERQYATFDSVSLVNFAANIYDDGRVLSLVVDSNPHGTHVAGIVAANFPQSPERNGVAPGAQIVSVKIGDTYLDGMETGAALIRGTKAVVENHCDLVNMSFGEPTKTPNRSLIIRFFQELVEKHGVVFVASAGNSGPALSTVGAPGATTTGLIGVGAYVSPEMMAAQYALRDPFDGLPFTWTSRGPTFDGDAGVSVCAPGAAITSVPRWTLDRSERMNGTSMASPNCCGNIALALSHLKAQKVRYSPASVQRAFENTAERLEGIDVFAQGRGLIQTDAAVEALLRDADKHGEQLRLMVTVPGRQQARGIYLREPHEAGPDAKAQEIAVQLKPLFAPAGTSEEQVAYQMRLRLESTADWVRSGEFTTVTANGQMLNVLVDPQELEPGVHFAEVLGFDADSDDRGPLVRIPVTVTKLSENLHDDDPVKVDRDTITRRFVAVPEWATWADLRMTVHPEDGTGRTRMFMIHTVQTLPGFHYRDGEHQMPTVFEADVEKTLSFSVQPGRTMELVIAQFWSSLGDCSYDWELVFHGLKPDQREVRLNPGEAYAVVDLATGDHHEQLAPVATLNTLRRQQKPSSAKVTTLSAERDGFDEHRLFHQLELTYDLDGPGSITPRVLKLDDLLYDSDFGGHVWAVFTAGGRRVATDDIWPHEISLGAGKHTLKVWLRHLDRSKLDALKSLPLAIDRPLSSPVSVAVHASPFDAQNNGARMASRTLKPGEHQQLFLVPPASVDGTRPGDVLLGTIRFGAKDAHGGSGDRPEGFTLSAVIGGEPAASAGTSSHPAWTIDDIETAKTAEERIARAVRDAEFTLLQSLSMDSERELFDRVLADLLTKHPNWLPALVLKLHKLDVEKKREERLDEIVAACDAVLGQINRDEIVMTLGLRVPSGDEAAGKKQARAEKLKALLIDTLYRKGRALGHMELPEVIAKKPIADPKAFDIAFESTYADLERWTDPTLKQHFLLHIRRATRKSQPGESLKWLNQYIPDTEPRYWFFEKRRELYQSLGWKHLEERQLQQRLQYFPGGEP